MAKVPTNNIVFYLNRRFLSVFWWREVKEAENVHFASAPKMKKVSDSGGVKLESPEEQNKQSFWMRDPDTGYWVPENHFGDIDAAELRDKHLSKKQEERRERAE
ncbi:hypothetical protein MRB53_030721 [Persea americana]|uniref:Uncharacterized protein n=1 Tax=Persea americana TaxID=3435 RepID=A0ACC2KMD1_PERAE|nr:hypothetical protein MRB53_030721 [Persea americana]